MGAHKGRIVTRFAKMWPREVFDVRTGRRLVESIMDLLDQPGVYILYREDQPYYVGQATCLYDRIWAHANRPKDRHYNFWNFFSAFVVPDKRHIDEVEGILIASMPTDNSSVLRMKKIYLPVKVATLIRSRRIIQLEDKTSKSLA